MIESRSAVLLSLLAASGVAACGSSTPTPDAGPVDAGPICDPAAQTGCASGQKCTLGQSSAGNTVTIYATCATAGTTAPYASCAADVECSGGTICSNIGQATAGLQTGQACYPFCNVTTSQGQACALGGNCVAVIQGSTFGLCDRAAPDAGPTDGG